jgi:hypothetical protein
MDDADNTTDAINRLHNTELVVDVSLGWSFLSFFLITYYILFLPSHMLIFCDK